MYACMYVCICVCVCVYLCMCMCMYMHMHIHMYMYMCMYMYTYVTNLFTHLRMHMLYVCSLYICVDMFLHACTCNASENLSNPKTPMISRGCALVTVSSRLPVYLLRHLMLLSFAVNAYEEQICRRMRLKEGGESHRDLKLGPGSQATLI